MKNIGTRALTRTAGLVALGSLAFAAGLFGGPSTPAHAQIAPGDFWLFQPQTTEPVGRAFCNADRSIEYWAYVDGVYDFASADNGTGNRWHLDAQTATGVAYPSFAAFQAAVLALPEFNGKRIQFQNHSVTSVTVQN